MAKKQTEDVLDTADVLAASGPGDPVVDDGEKGPPPREELAAPLGEEVSYEAAAAWWKSGRTEEEAAAMLAAHSADGQYFIPR